MQRLPDGRMNLLTVGRRRFRIVEITQWRPYVAGEIVFLAEESAPAVDRALVARVREELAGYVQRLLALAGEGGGDSEGGEAMATPIRVPRDPVELGYTASAALQIPGAVKQALLEDASAAGRLEKALDHLVRDRAEQELLLRARGEPGGGAAPPPGANGGTVLN